MKNFIIVATGLIIIIFLATFAGCNVFSTSTSPQTASPQQSGIAAQTTNPNRAPQEPVASNPARINLPSFAALLKAVESAVVKIDVQIPTTSVFGRTVVQQGAGSGWILNSNGQIVTANHVVDGASSITVTTLDGKTYPAKLVKGDATIDLAVLAIATSALPILSPADASSIQVGDWALAIGNPLGEGIIATQGIISRLGVDVPVSSTQTYSNMIETTAAINPGNSGGPLINLSGEVIGITSLKVSSAGIEGLSYAINIGDALPAIQKLTQ
jgi:serine protease Do